jgi:outer membrane protein assembly factor BamB
MRPILPILLAATLLAACAERELILPGERLSIRGDDPVGLLASATPEAAPNPVPILLPAPRRLADWTQRVGAADNDPGHATLSAAPRRVWSASIGAGATRRLALTADPVSDGRAIYTLDARSRVAATGLDGAPIWSRSLVPAVEREGDASGGGAAVAGDTLYVSTGYGRLHALDAATGAERWVQRLDAPITTPKVVGGTVYVVSRDNRAWALTARTGRLLWELPAPPAGAVIATAPSPAVTDRLAIFPFASGEVLAVLRRSGLRVWSASVSGARTGVAYAGIGDITGDPVVSGGAVFAGTTAGRLVALDLAGGERLWTAREGAVSPVAVAGGSVFAVTDRAQAIRLDARTGAALWRQDLPLYQAARIGRREGVFVHHGPVLAGNRLWIASSDGALRGLDPASGAITAVVEIPGGAASRPIAFGDALYVVSRDGRLHAYR